jgi:undecaprenyl-diphosphatase
MLMAVSPTDVDVWVATFLGGFLKRNPTFDMAVQSAIRHNILGGFWFGAALFVCWVRAAGSGLERIRVRVLTIMTGATLAVVFTVLAGMVISWPSPNNHPLLRSLYPPYIDPNPNANSFPSQSTALYGAVAAGMYSVRRIVGVFLWVAVVMFVALPRMYVGGHYLSDILAGMMLGMVGYTCVRFLAEEKVISRLERAMTASANWDWVAEVLIFAWILEVSLEFREVVWLKQGIQSILG